MIAANLAVALAREGLPFRKAHHLVGALVGEAQKTGRSLKAVAAERLAKDAAERGRTGRRPLRPARGREGEVLAGGTAPDAVRASLDAAVTRVAI